MVAVVDRSLSFPSAEFVRRALRKAAERHAHGAPLVIDATHVQAADFTAAKVRTFHLFYVSYTQVRAQIVSEVFCRLAN